MIAMRIRIALAASALFAVLLLRAAAPDTLADLRQAFEHPPDDARIMVRWWWFGPAVAKPELEREMRAMKEGGIGGFEVQPTYPLEVDHNFPYLSDEFLPTCASPADKANELGLRFDLTLGSGWPFGGPHIPHRRSRRTPEGGSLHPSEAPPRWPGRREAGRQRFEPNSAAALLHRQPHPPDRQAPRRGRRRLRARSLQPRRHRHASESRRRKLLDAVPKNPPHAIFSDRLEVYNSDWTGDFLAEFQKRRGYDLTPLPARARPGHRRPRLPPSATIGA